VKLPRFYIRRAFKIIPSFFFLVLALWWTGALALTPMQWLSFLTFTQNYVLEGRSGPTWSLAVEEHFYILFPLALIAAIKVGRRLSNPHVFPWFLLFVAGCCLALRIINAVAGIDEDDFMLSHFRVDSIMTGVGCYYLWSRHPQWIEPIVNRLSLSLALVALLIMQTLFFDRADEWMFSFGFSLLGVAYGILLLVVVETRLFGMAESGISRALAYVGRKSYNIYLWHYFLLLIPAPGYEAIQLLVLRHFEAGLASLIQVIVLILYSILVGVIMTAFVEKPFLDLRRRILG